MDQERTEKTGLILACFFIIKGGEKMLEVIDIILAGCAGIIIGASFGYVKGYDVGFKRDQGKPSN